MDTYGKGAKCDKLWCVWHGILISILHLFLVYNGVTRYLSFKFLAFDPKFGGHWDQTGLNLSLAMLICAIGSFCLLLFVSVIRTTNYASESIQVGRDLNSINVLSLGQAWRSAIPLTTLPTAFMTNRTYSPGPVVNGGLAHRPHFAAMSSGSDGEHTSALAGEEIMTTGDICDTWPRQNGVNLDTLNRYHASNMPQCIQSQECTHQSHLSIQQSLCILWRQLKKHFFPYTSVLHLLTAYCLLLPMPIFQAQQMHHGASDSGWLWRSDMDFVFDCLQITEKKSTHPRGASAMGSTADYQAVPASERDSSSWDNLRSISPEFFNLALVFVVLVLRYPSVFWYTSRSFSFLFSLMIFLTGVHALIEYSAASVLVKLAWNVHLLPHIPSFRLLSAPLIPPVPSSTGMTFGGSFVHERYSDADRPVSPSALASVVPLFLSTLSTLLFLFLFLTVFEYGYRQFLDNLAAYRLYLIDTTGTHSVSHAANSNPADGHIGALQNGLGPVYNPSESGQSGMNESGKFTPCFNGTSFLTRKSPPYGLGADMLHPATRCCLFTYAPHMWALVGGLCVLAIKFPLIWDCIQIHRVTRCTLLLASSLSGIALLCVWFIVWFAFGLKPAWKFQVNLPINTLPEPSMLPHFQPTATGPILRPIRMGGRSVTNFTALGSRCDQASRLFTSQAPFQSVGPLTPSGNCFIPSDGSATHTGIPVNPTYTCFHVSNHGAFTRGPRFTPNMESTVANDLPTRTSHEQCGDDTEASSSTRQNGSNYVCLHSAFTSAGWDSSNPGLMAPIDAGGVFAQLPQPASQCAVRMPYSSMPTCSQVSFGCAENSAPGITVDTTSVASLNASERECGSTSVTYSFAQHNTGTHDGTTYQSNSLRPCYLQRCYSPTLPAQSAMAAVDRLLIPSAKHQSPGHGPLRRDTCGRSQFALDPSSVRLIPTTTANQCGQRTSFERNVEPISGVSPTTSDNGSHNNSSDDSGIDNLKLEHRNPPLTAKPFGSGPYDNAFPASVCSSIPVGILNPTTSQFSRTLQGSAATSSMVSPSVDDSIYSAHAFAVNAGGKLCPSQNPISGSVLGTVLMPTSEMIGDATSGCQCSTSEQLPLLLYPELLVDEAQLCSQV